MKKISVLVVFAVLMMCIASPVSALFNLTFDADDEIHANQSVVQDPTQGKSIPWDLYIASGVIALILVVLALVRPKAQRMDYEVNIILSVLAWPFELYWTWGGITSVDYIVGFAGVTMSDSAATTNEAAFVTQHILYSFWVLGWVGVAGFVFAAFVTALLVAQYKLFNDNEAEAKARGQQREMMKDGE